MTDKELGTAAGEIFAKAFTLGYETGREYVPVGGRVLTAELVEDVRALVWLDGRRNFDAFRRLRALFPATEPAADAKPCGSNSVTLGWCKLTARHEGLHTNGTYLWGTPSEPDPPAPAEPAEEETKAEVHDPDALAKRLAWIWHDGWDACGERERGYLRRAAEMAHSHYASSPVVPAPTETGPWQFCDMKLGPHEGHAHWTPLVAPALVETAWPSLDAEPAEEETKAERDSEGIIRINGGRIVALSRDPRELVQQWFDLAEPGSKWQRDYAAALDLFDREAASSPVVPAPTETGPWQRIEDVPETVGRLTDRDGDIWEWDGDNWVTPETAILPTTYINRKYAPFVAAKEG